MPRRLTRGSALGRRWGQGAAWGFALATSACSPQTDGPAPLPPAGMAGLEEGPAPRASGESHAAVGPLDQKPGATIVTVGSTVFIREDFERALFLLAARAGVPPGPLSDDVMQTLELPAFKQLLKRGLLYEEAQRRGLRLSEAEVEVEVARVLSQGGQGRPADEVLQRMRTDRASLTRDVGIDGSIARLLERLRQELPAVDEAAARRVYDGEPERWQRDARVRLRQILVQLTPTASADEVEGARRQADELRAAVVGLGEEKFASLAQERSDDKDTRDRGGALGWVSRRGLLPDLSEAAFSLAVGQVSPVVRTERGLHLLFVAERQEREVPFEAVRDQIVATERYLRGREQERRLLSDLEERTPIEVRVGPRSSEDLGGLPSSPAPGAVQEGSGAPHGALSPGGGPHVGGLPLPSKDNVLPGVFNPHAGELRIGGAPGAEPPLRLPARP